MKRIVMIVTIVLKPLTSGIKDDAEHTQTTNYQHFFHTHILSIVFHILNFMH